MVSLDIELQSLKDKLLEMMDLVKGQLVKCKTSLEEHKEDVAEEVVEKEKRVNSLELTIDKECENILALHNPVATDLRFVLSTLKICADLESIGDIAKGLAKTSRNHIRKSHRALLDKFRILKMLEVSIAMLEDMREAVQKEDAQLGEKIAEKDKVLNEINKEAAKTAADLIKDHEEKIELILKLFTITRKLERVGDFVKNIGAELVFHIEARVLKHQKAK
jgi:phosphate transport system protein